MKYTTVLMKYRNRMLAVLMVALSSVSSCNYLDIVPDNIATIDYAFRLRSQAEKYLFTCYSYLPHFASWGGNPALLSGDEIWFFYPYKDAYYGTPPSNWEIARGNQNINSPYLNYWDGASGGTPLFQGIRDCNTFLANIDKVPDMEDREKARWKGEVMFLKAYYHWYLLRMYGPIPIIDKSEPVSTGIQEAKVYREPVDSCFDYIVGLLDSAARTLPETIDDPVSEMGRITKPIALAVKARVLMNAVSPLFNGNADYANMVDNKGRHLFNTEYDPQKWVRAAAACKAAITLCETLGNKLYHFNPLVNIYNLGDTLQVQMDIRNAICEKWNAEIIWGDNGTMMSGLQQIAQPILNPSISTTNGNGRPHGEYAPPLQIAEMFYTENGVPIDEDKTWDYQERYALDTATDADQFYIKSGYVTARLNFDREPRFYADLGFDGGIWYGQGKYDQGDSWHVEGRSGGYSGKVRASEYSITGYYCKKLVNFLNVLQTSGTYQVQAYPFPVIRLADLYLYYAEALNESQGPTAEALSYVNKVRQRAGIPTVEESWGNFSKHPDKYKSKDGFREIIHRERLIEMAFEGGRYWDLRRWKEAEKLWNKPILGWDISESDPTRYYQVNFLFNRSFKRKDYFWPIKERDIVVNDNLVQNSGW